MLGYLEKNSSNSIKFK